MKISPDLVTAVIDLARRAGDAILSVYESDEFDVQAKGDGSPLTRADRLAHETIATGLRGITPSIPLMSEESGPEAENSRQGWRDYWLVDPLDGTKEFIKRNDEFTVNIAYVAEGRPILGVVWAPALGRGYAGSAEQGAWRFGPGEDREVIRVRGFDGGPATVVASRSHRGEAVDAFLRCLAERRVPAEVRSMGSSLKLCLVAEGVADVYPRLGPTSEWDTAAAHAVVEAAGGRVIDVAGRPLRYNKASILNPWFLAVGGGDFPWHDCVPSADSEPS